MSSSNSCSSETSTPSSYIDNNQQQNSNNVGTPQSKESVRSERNTNYESPSPVNAKPQLRDLFSNHGLSPSNGNHTPSPTTTANGSSDEEEWNRFSQVKRKKDFVHYERVDGRKVNVVQGLELHTGVFSAEEQKKIVESVYNFQKMGRKGQLMGMFCESLASFISCLVPFGFLVFCLDYALNCC